MLIIKLDAIDSTNDYLKALANDKPLDNFTTVVAQNQTKGRGQLGTQWQSEPDKNLTMSILFKEVLTDKVDIFYINAAVAITLIRVLESLNIPKVTVKWPNDIMADAKKVGGILIENSIKSDGTIRSIIGIGLNVNQTDFSNLPKATSIALEIHKEINKDTIMIQILKQLKNSISLLSDQSDQVWQSYHDYLFKKNIPMAFQDNLGNKFMGIIQSVSRDGMLQLLLEDDSIASFGIKEITMLF
jgi:BirA family biotin operon repressor/biotin-[acetyl-CoA-carboxylase] ligase